MNTKQEIGRILLVWALYRASMFAVSYVLGFVFGFGICRATGNAGFAQAAATWIAIVLSYPVDAVVFVLLVGRLTTWARMEPLAVYGATARYAVHTDPALRLGTGAVGPPANRRRTVEAEVIDGDGWADA